MDSPREHLATRYPGFITHYHLPDRPPFLNLSDLDKETLTSTLADLDAIAAGGRSERRFGPQYMNLRRATERRLRERFIERGGQPERTSPHYFVLGESEWFKGLYRPAAEVRLDISTLPPQVVSVTYPDSLTSMGLLPEFGINVESQPHHGLVFRLDELPQVVERFGLLDSPRPNSYTGHPHANFEHYIEVQVLGRRTSHARRPVRPLTTAAASALSAPPGCRCPSRGRWNNVPKHVEHLRA